MPRVHELPRRQARRAEVPAGLVELRMQRPEQSAAPPPEISPLATVIGRIAGECRRQAGIGHLERVARHDPHPPPAAREDRRERHHVVLDDDVGVHLVEHLPQPRVDVPVAPSHNARNVGSMKPAEGLDRRPPEDRRGVADEVLPELTGRLGLLGRRRQPHSRSSNPCASSVPAKDSSTTKTTRCPRCAARCRCRRSCSSGRRRLPGRTGTSPSARASVLTSRTRPRTVQHAQPQPPPPAVVVGAGDRAPSDGHHRGTQRLRRERERRPADVVQRRAGRSRARAACRPAPGPRSTSSPPRARCSPSA